jgi:uncharacterized protein YukE
MVRPGEASMTAKGSASPLASFAAQWIGADIRGLHALATTLYGYRPEITGATTTLNQEVSQLTGGGQGWRGPAASAFSAAWRRDAAAAEALALVIGQTADVVDDLAVGLAMIEKTLEDDAYVAARYGVPIGADGRPPPVPDGPPGDAATASEQHWARTYRQAYDRRTTRPAAIIPPGTFGTACSSRPGRARRVITGPLPARGTVSRGM